MNWFKPRYRISRLIEDMAQGNTPPAWAEESIKRTPPQETHRIPEYSPNELSLYRPPSHGGPYYFWGGQWVPLRELKSTLFLGASGTGKSHQVLTMLGQIARAVTPQSNRRMLVVASKRDALELLSALSVPYRVINLNDPSSPGWDVATDYQSYTKLSELASIIVRRSEKASDPFWGNAAQMLIAGIMKSYFYRFGTDWGFHDVVLGAKSDFKDVLSILSHFPGNEGLVAKLGAGDVKKTRSNIELHVLSEIDRLEPFAAHCQAAKSEFSLTNFLASESVWVIQPDLDERESVNPVVHAFIKRLTDLTSALSEASSEYPPRQVIVFLDEAQFLGKIPGVAEFCEFTRSKGGSLILSSQSIDGLHEVYGDKKTESILGNFPYKTILHMDSKVSVEWSVNLMGQVEVWSRSDSVSSSVRGGSYSESYRWERRQRLLPSDILDLPLASPSSGIHGYYVSGNPAVSPEGLNLKGRIAYKFVTPPKVVSSLRPSGLPVSQGRRDSRSHYLKPWGLTDHAKFISGLSKESIEFQALAAEAYADTMAEFMREAFNSFEM